MYRAELYAACRAFELAPGHVTVVSDCYGVVQQAQSVIKGAHIAARRPHVDLWRRMSVAVQAKAARGERVDIRWVPAHLPEEEAGGPKITREDWEGNQMADHWAKESLKEHPDQRGRAERIDEFDTLAVGALRIGMAVYSQVVLDRDARGAIPKRRNRVPGGPMGRALNRDWPWLVRGHSIEPVAGEAPVLVQSHWKCTRCNCGATTRGSLRVLGKRPCHGGRVRSRVEVSVAGNIAKWNRRAAAAAAALPPGTPVPRTHRISKDGEFWKCACCGGEQRKLRDLGFFCDDVQQGVPPPPPGGGGGAPQAKRMRVAAGSMDIRSFFGGAASSSARPPEVLD